MKTLVCLTSAIMLTLSIHLFAADQGEWKVQVTGLRVVAPPVNAGENSRGAFFASPGISVVATVTASSAKIVTVDQFASKLDLFTDDKGTDLLSVKSEDPFNKPGFSGFNNTDTNVTLEIQAAGLPAKGATTLNVSGKLSLKIATSTKQFTIENVAIKPGTAFNCGDIALKITKAGMSKAMFADKEQFSVTLSSATDLEGIASLEFFDAQGKKSEAHRDEWGGGMGAYFATYSFKEGIDRAKIVATCWQGLQTVEVPISVKTGIGL